MQSQQNMTDKEYMEDVLLTAKTATNLYSSAVQESPTSDLHCKFKDILNESLDMQKQVFTVMSQKGWYPVPQAEQQKINQVKSKFQAQ